jgi:hypothetical protein
MLDRKRRGVLQWDAIFARSQYGCRYGGIEGARAGGGEQRGGWQARVGLQRGKRERACFSVQVSAAVRMRSSLQLNSHGIYLHLDFICTLVSSSLAAH